MESESWSGEEDETPSYGLVDDLDREHSGDFDRIPATRRRDREREIFGGVFLTIGVWQGKCWVRGLPFLPSSCFGPAMLAQSQLGGLVRGTS